MLKVVLFCVLMAVQSISGQCLGNPGYLSRPYTSPVITSATIGPGGTINICSDDLLISGPIIVAGKLPFSGSVALEGCCPTAGAGGVNYGCGEPLGVLAETPIGLVAGYGFRH